MLNSVALPSKQKQAPKYKGIKETIYFASNPEVIRWTGFFSNRCREKGIFQTFSDRNSKKSKALAEIVGISWHEFSEFMPWLLCQAAAKVSTNEKRHYVIQSAFEELGMRSADEIHPNMFWELVQSIGVSNEKRFALRSSRKIRTTLEFLKDKLFAYSTDCEILGLLLGLEIPATENIECVFSSLAHTKNIEIYLGKHKFFTLHRTIETEHVRLTVSNFLRFCSDESSKRRFLTGFDDGVSFWEQFWGSVDLLLKREGNT